MAVWRPRVFLMTQSSKRHGVERNGTARPAQIRVSNGFSTREEETRGMNGGNYKRNAQQLKRENQMLADAQNTTKEGKNNG